MDDKTGGPAFPHAAVRNDSIEWVNGLTIRDYMAGQALQGMLIYSGATGLGGHLGVDSEAANKAYAFADLMIAARGDK